MTTRIEVNIQTGERREIPLTQAEIASANANTIAEDARKDAEKDMRADVGTTDPRIRAIVTWVAGQLGVPETQALQEIRQIARGLL